MFAGGIMYKFNGIKYVKNVITSKIEVSTGEVRKTQFDILETDNNPIIMLGDSMIENGEWSELLRNDVINRGIGGNTTYNILNRIDEIVSRKPSKVCLLVGINDLNNNTTNEKIIENYNEIINSLKVNEETKIYIISVLPVNHYFNYNKVDNKKIISLNLDLKNLADQSESEFIDVFDVFSDEENLNLDYTYDGVHLNGKGYKILSDILKSKIL